jgi:protein-arginine kinase activator protein McsA
LRRNLDEAVSKEDYESAATIRDEIRELESED